MITIRTMGLTACTLAMMLTCNPASAAYNATIQGTLDWVEQAVDGSGYTNGTIRFRLQNQPTVNCGGWDNFIISPNSIQDAQSRNNMLAILLAAKASGAQVLVAYDSNGGAGCDQGSPEVYYLRMM